MTPQAHQCEFCGAPAVVHVMHEIGRPGSARHLCMACADGCEQSGRERQSLNLRAAILSIGLFLLGVAIMADWLGIGHGYGFGPWQALALLMSLIIICAGAMLRISSVFLFGLCVLLMTLAADYMGLDGHQGFGAGQAIASILACLLIGAGVTLGRFRRANA